MSTATLPPVTPATVDFAPFSLILPPTVQMTQDQFFDFCQLNGDKRFERTAEGELIVMAPSCGESGIQDLSVGAQLWLWNQQTGKGKATGPSGGFILPNGANRAPDAAWMTPEQVASLSPQQLKKFLPLCPFFLIEVKSPSDSLKTLQEKMEEYISNGCQLAWLIVPETKQVLVYRPGQEVATLDNIQTVSGDPELPGFVLDLVPVWNP